jgi:hypothetical protein
MTQEQSRIVMVAEPLNYEKVSGSGVFVDAYYNSTFQVFFSPSDATVDFIELSRAPEHTVRLGGIDIFATAADSLLTRISRASGQEARSKDGGYSYVFDELSLTLWRPVLPEDEDEGQFFETVGIQRTANGRDAA